LRRAAAVVSVTYAGSANIDAVTQLCVLKFR